MEIDILKSDKDDIELKLENVTMAEILRVYLNKDPAVNFVAWKRAHPTEKPLLKIQTKGKTAKKAVNDAIALIEKDLDKLLGDFKKLK